jgi:hypothetical protein
MNTNFRVERSVSELVIGVERGSKRRLARGLVVAALAALAGCGTGGAWSADGFSQTTYGWKASYAPGQGSLLGDQWRVDNWELRSDGSYGEKAGPGFTSNEHAEGEVGAYYLYDLKLAHKGDDGVIWLKTHMLAEADAKKSLEVLVDSYLHAAREIDSLHGLGLAPRSIVSRAGTRLGANRALAVSLMATPVSSPGAEPVRIDLILTKFDYLLPDAPGTSTGAGPSIGTPPSRRTATAFMVVGYSNDATAFDSSRDDLDKLVARLTWSPSPKKVDAAGDAADDGDAESCWTETGFEQRRYGWKAAFAPGQNTLVSADWRLLESDAAGASGYKGRPDLSFDNVHNNGFVWTETITLDADEATKDLDVLFDNYVGRLAEVIGFKGQGVISSREEISLGPNIAVSATIERQPTTDEREGRVKTNATKLRLVVTKFSYLERPAKAGARRSRAVAFMVVGYGNDSKRFDSGLEDFARFLGRFTWPAPSSPTPAGKPDAPRKPPAKLHDPNQPETET